MSSHRKRPVAVALLTLLTSLLLPACGSVSPAPAKSRNSTMTFHIEDTVPGDRASRVLTSAATVTLTVSKVGHVPLVAGAPADGQVSGVHSFPRGATRETVARHYADLLTIHGWVSGVDFVRSENSIHLYGVNAVALHCDNPQLHANLAVD